MDYDWLTLPVENKTLTQVKLKIIQRESFSKGIVLHFHGFPGGPIEEDNFIGKKLAELNYTFVTFNYPGLWNANGFFTIDHIFLSIKTITDELKTNQRFKGRPVFLFCESFGAVVGINLLQQRLIKVDKIVLRSPLLDFTPILPYLPITFKQVTMMGILRLPEKGFNFSELGKYNPKNLLDQVPIIPIWGVIGKNDEVLPAETMKHAVIGKDWINLELWNDFPHNAITNTQWNQYFNKMISFIEQYDQ